ncbi:MAG TPA: hypothetical protein VIC35_00350 [Acidimicrobiia bacterium]
MLRTDARVRLCVKVLLVALLLLPPLIALVATVGRPWVPVDDFAIIDLRTRDVWSSHAPLVGLVSRNGWSHPGPVVFWLLGLFSGLVGQASWATRVGGTLLQMGALTWLAIVTWRRGLAPLLAAATVTACTYLAVGPWLFVQPWNLWIPIPFFILFVFLSYLAATGAFRQLIAMSLVATFLAQTHVSYVPLVVAGFLWVGVCVAVDARRAQRAPDRWKSTGAICLGVWVISWIPPVVDLALHWPANLGRVVSYFATGRGSHVGFADALGLTSAEFRPVPPWLGGTNHTNPFSGFAQGAPLAWLVVPVALLALGALAARRAGSRDLLRALGFAAVLLVVGVVAMARADEPLWYTFQWRVVVAAFVMVVSAWSIAAAAEGVARSATRAVALVGTLAIVVWGSVSHASSIDPNSREPRHHGDLDALERRAPALTSVMRQARRGHQLERKEILVLNVGPTRSLFDGVVNELDRAGVSVHVARSLKDAFGRERATSTENAGETWYVTEQGSEVPELLRLPGARLVADTSPLDPRRDAQLTRAQQELQRQLRNAGRADLAGQVDDSFIAYNAAHAHVDQRLVQTVAQLDSRVEQGIGCRCAIVAVRKPDQ